MTTIFVQSSDLNDAADRVAAISPSLTALQGGVSQHAHAARHTKASDGLSDLAAHWGAVLPHFSNASDGLVAALRAAAADYHSADTDVANAALNHPVSGALDHPGNAASH